MLKKFTLWNWISILAFIGILLASYLYYNYLFQPVFKPCYVSSSINCDAATIGPLKLTFGIPTALYGLVGYILILIGSFIKNIKLVLAVATFGLLFCLYILYREIFEIYVYCIVCIACLIDMSAVFFLSLKLKKNNKS